MSQARLQVLNCLNANIQLSASAGATGETRAQIFYGRRRLSHCKISPSSFWGKYKIIRTSISKSIKITIWDITAKILQ